MNKRLLCFCVILWCAYCAEIHGQQIPFQVRAGSLRDEYLVGEPVDIYYGVCNSLAYTRPIPSHDSAFMFFDMLISRFPNGKRKGESFYFWGLPSPRSGIEQIQLDGAKWHFYRLRVFYSFPVPERIREKCNNRKYCRGIAFSRSGEYSIAITQKFFIPLVPLDALDSGGIAEPIVNWQVVPFRITLPRSGSAEERVWREIRDRKMLEFIQTHGETGTPELALKVARILRDMPVSRYHNSLQAVLGAYYRRHWQKHNVGERALIDIALRRKFPPDIVPQNRRRLLRLLYRHAPELYRELNVKLAPEKEKRPATK